MQFCNVKCITRGWISPPLHRLDIDRLMAMRFQDFLPVASAKLHMQPCRVNDTFACALPFYTSFDNLYTRVYVYFSQFHWLSCIRHTINNYLIFDVCYAIISSFCRKFIGGFFSAINDDYDRNNTFDAVSDEIV